MECVYLIRSSHSPGHYKIGVTGDWARRAKELRVGYLSEEIFHYDVADAYQVEKELHCRFDSTRLPQSEWFLLDTADIVYIQQRLIELSIYGNIAREDAHCEDLKGDNGLPVQNSPRLGSDSHVCAESFTQEHSTLIDYCIQALGYATVIVLGGLGLYLLVGIIAALVGNTGAAGKARTTNWQPLANRQGRFLDVDLNSITAPEPGYNDLPGITARSSNGKI